MEKGAKTKPKIAVADEESALQMVIENNIALQKVLTDLAIGINKLSKEISEMLDLFREASKSIAMEKAEEAVKKEDLASLKDKVDSLLDQNKTIAQGILLLESSVKPKQGYSEQYGF